MRVIKMTNDPLFIAQYFKCLFIYMKLYKFLISITKIDKFSRNNSFFHFYQIADKLNFNIKIFF